MLGNGKFDDGVFITFGWENYYAFPIDYELGLLSLEMCNASLLHFSCYVVSYASFYMD